jgi:hypothetical protein
MFSKIDERPVAHERTTACPVVLGIPREFRFIVR